jgi:hypothetical protein
MQFAIDPPIATKMARMKQRVRWQDPVLVQRGIDQTSLVLDDERDDNPEFSFMVLGDSGSGPHRGHDPQRRIAEQMLLHRDNCRFILHTGDVIYSVGSSEFYPQNFIAPYREFLVNGTQHRRIAFDRMVFNLPFLPVPGNHDYYDLPLIYGVLSQMTAPLRYLLQSQLDLDVGWHGSSQGNDYARAFLDYLKAVNSPDLERHLDQHYTAKTETGRCLRYQPGKFTRLPNRYYTFRAGGIDFFALDSNTINAPVPLPETAEGDRERQQLLQQQANIDVQMQEVTATAASLNAKNPDHAEQLDDLKAKLQQLSEVKKDIEKQLTCDTATVTDLEQLEWLQERLIASWRSPDVRGRVIYFHHPPYVTEATKWHQAQTLAIRQRLRRVLNGVAIALGQRDNCPIVDLVLSGHAHCFEHLRTLDTGYADAHTNWIVCGGSGYSLRRQRQEGTDLCEGLSDLNLGEGRTIARSLQFVGRSGQGFQKRRPYSFLRIDVKPGTPPQFVVRPFVSEWYERGWKDYAIEPFVLE